MPQTAAHASPINGLPWAEVPRILLIGAAVGVIESLIGAFALDDDPIVGRTIYVVVLNLFGAAYGILAYWAVRHAALLRKLFWARVLAADLLAIIPGTLTLWASTFLVGGHPGPAWLFLTYSLGFGFLLSGAFIATFIAPCLDKAWEWANDTAASPEVSAPQASFMDRLPFRLRGAELWALRAEDHYLRVITSRGETLIRMRLADAVRELRGVEGARSHRSWWVARTAVADMRREDGRVRILVLPDGRETPVSRAGVETLAQAGWF